jgi:TRAP-type C4-dicarboxylate transport system permease small subunit
MAETDWRGWQGHRRWLSQVVTLPRPAIATGRFYFTAESYTVRKILDPVYEACLWLAGLFMIGALAMVLLGILGRLMHFNLRGTDSFAGFCIAGALFLALGATLRRGEHIRVTLLLQHLPPGARRVANVISYVSGLVLSSALAWFSWRLVLQSHEFNDVSQGMDATPLWVPQLAMAIGATILAIAVLDGLIESASRDMVFEEPGELARVE